MSVEESNRSLRERLDRIQRVALIAGVVALAACFALGLALGLPQFFRSYLIAFLFWLGLPLGCTSLLLLNHLAGGTWGLVIRRPLEAGAATVPLLTVLFLPIALGLSQIYPWAGPGGISAMMHASVETESDAEALPAGTEVVRAIDLESEGESVATDEEHGRSNKEIWYDRPFYFGRAVGYFVVWNLLAWLLLRWSDKQDQTTDPWPTRRLGKLGAPGLILLFLTGSFAMFDWVMSLEPLWYSTIFGAMLITGQGLQTFAFVIAATTLLADRGEMEDLPTPSRLRDLGNLLLAFVMLWAYTQYSQFIIIWSGNLAEEVPWYIKRTSGGWGYVAVFLIVFHFFLPFFVLLFRGVKQSPRRLRWIAMAIFAVHLVDIYWLTAPGMTRPGDHGLVAAYPSPLPSLLDPLAIVGLGGLWLGAYTYVLKTRPLVPRNDPDLAALREHEIGRHSHQGGA